jgi:DNA-binding response OmpR family regulator
MHSPMVPAWESDNSQFHIRRRACLAAGGRVQNRVAVLLVDHDSDVVSEFTTAVAGQPLEIRTCADPAEALLVVGRTCPDVVMLGPSSGRLDPVEFIRIVRADDPDVPIIVGAGTGSGDFAARAADAGASVVVPRPYRARDLIALLASYAPQSEQVSVRPMEIDLGRLKIDGAVPQIWLDGQQIELPMREFLLLRYFAERVGAVHTRDELLNAVWGGRHSAKSNTLTVHILRLRKRLGDNENDPQWIKAIRGLGYQFVVPDREPPSHST